MSVARRAILMLMLVLVLPWGAVLRVAEARAAGSEPVGEAAATVQPSSVRAAAPAHRCRTATLPGSPCLFHATLPDGPGLIAPGEGQAAIRPAGGARHGLLRDAPDTGPPRLL